MLPMVRTSSFAMKTSVEQSNLIQKFCLLELLWMCVHIAHEWRVLALQSTERLKETSVSSSSVGPKDQTQVVRLVQQELTCHAISPVPQYITLLDIFNF